MPAQSEPGPFRRMYENGETPDVSEFLHDMSEPLTLNDQNDDEFIAYIMTLDMWCERHGLSLNRLAYMSYLVQTGHITDYPGEVQHSLHPAMLMKVERN